MTIVDPTEYTRKVFDWAAKAGLKQVRLVIHQPKLGGPTEDVVPMEDLEAFARELHLKADRVRVADAMFDEMGFGDWWPIYLNPEPSREACEYCRAMPTCPSMQAKLQRDTQIDFGAIDEYNEAPKPPAGTVDLNRAMSIVPVLEDWCTATRAEVERQLMAGVEFPDFGLELGRQGNRRWADPDQAEKTLREMKLNYPQVYNLKLRTPTQIEKLTKGDKDPLTGERMKPVVGPVRWKRIQKFVTRDDPSPSVKPKAVIKVPWSPKPVDASAFMPVPDDGEDLT